MPDVTQLRKKVGSEFLYGKSVAVTQNTVKSVEIYESIRHEFAQHERKAVCVFLKNMILVKPPLTETDQSTIEQGLIYGEPISVDPKHSAQFISRLVHVKVLDRSGSTPIKIKAGQEIVGCAAPIYHQLTHYDVDSGVALHSSSNSR
ncbi:hypothetical protein [Endozoicomonas atrinae]|uniref:hypothetical protein n=1 Tax=Endozoicomonas atrinae TaxID=1333660 RepID=UPI003B008A1F